MSNMYTILESLKRAMPEQQPQEAKPAQPVYESVEARGSIVAGVKDVEQRLREQFEAMKEGEKVATKTGTIHKGTYGTEYQGDPDDEDAPKRGRPAKGTAKKEKVVKVKGPKGRPKKDPAPVYSKSNDPFGRVPDKAPKGKKGTVIKGKATQDTNESQLDELSPKTLGSYIKHAAMDAKFKGHQAGNQQGWAMAKSPELFGGIDAGSDTDEKAHSRVRGVRKATDKLVGKVSEVAKNPYAIGMAQAKKETGLGKATAKNLPKSTIKRAHHIGDTIKANEGRQVQLTNMLLEGVNFTEMIKKKDMTLQEMLAELQADIQTFKETGHCSELLRDCMEVHSFNKQQLNDAVKGPSFAPQHPGTPEPKPTFMDKAKEFGGKVLNTLGHGSDEDLKADLRRKMDMQEASELNELARLAGLTVAEANDGNLANNAKPYDKVTRGDVIAGRLGKDEQGGKKEVDEGDMEEGNEFSGELAKAKAAHKTEFEVDGKTYPVKEGEACPTCKSEPCACEEVEDTDKELAKLKENCGIVSPIGSMAQEMQQQQGRISVSTNMSSDGNKNVSINADGEAADQLMQILKMAGMAGAHHEHHADVVIAAQPMEAKEYGDTDIEKPEEVLNTPRPDVRGMHRAETVGYADTTDDLNKQKDQDPETANKAANPKAAKVNKVEESSPLEALGAKLMAEYQAIKITK